MQSTREPLWAHYLPNTVVWESLTKPSLKGKRHLLQVGKPSGSRLPSLPSVVSLKHFYHPFIYIPQVWYSYLNRTNISVPMVWRCITELAMDIV
uniref:hypothetical protein n=1 Tax=Brasilonema sp. UFV-L1 TaxID=2234130 RepID=UPI0030D8F824